jgi:hypothetical protein
VSFSAAGKWQGKLFQISSVGQKRAHTLVKSQAVGITFNSIVKSQFKLTMGGSPRRRDCLGMSVGPGDWFCQYAHFFFCS